MALVVVVAIVVSTVHNGEFEIPNNLIALKTENASLVY
jgi:hypothetical protein